MVCEFADCHFVKTVATVTHMHIYTHTVTTKQSFTKTGQGIQVENP